MARQKQIEEAILRQAKPLTVLTKFQELAAAGKALFKSDLPQSMIGTMLDLGAKAKKLELRKEDLVPPKFDYLHPDFAVAREIVNAIVFPPPATPSPTPPR